MNKHVIFHGHFYQPPRENPWTGLIPVQPSAAPFQNWNERIFSECYRANSASRYLNPEGRIVQINNNYERISFNFGPTLLNWIKEYHSDLYKKIQEADKRSMEIYKGHGNAIAQVYNHIIMPLADEEDKRVQIEWGIEDFKSHFNRLPEGMWLAETAVDYKTVDLLIEYGIKYIILSPWQCLSTREKGSHEKFTQTTNPLDVAGEAFSIKGSKGEIAAFFYDHVLAQGVSFEHYLQDADRLHGILLEKAAIGNKPLIHCATDGEIFGHHEPFGDMCYSALIEKLKKGSAMVLNNYGNFLEEVPPTKEARIKLGEKNLGSSWSCYHGVSRWYKDCGCSTGSQEGWDQKWRKPLRDSFDQLNLHLRSIFEKEMKKICSESPNTVWHRYIDVLTETISRDEFSKKYCLKKDDKTINRFFSLLESRKFSMYMYTSCGWFFSEISGIEPVQNICYALRSIELADKENNHLRTLFLKHLAKAKSNIAEKGTGKDIAEEAELFYRRTPFHVAAEFVARSIAGVGLSANKEAAENRPGDYCFKELSFKSKNDSCSGVLSFNHRYLKKEWKMEFHVSIDNKNGALFEFTYNGQLELIPAKEAGISPSIRHSMILRLLSDWNNSDERFTRLLILLEEMAEDQSGLSDETRSFYYNLINLRIEKIIDEPVASEDELKKKITLIEPLLNALTRSGYHLTASIEIKLSEFLYSQVKAIQIDIKQLKPKALIIIQFCKTLYLYQVKCDMTESQGIAFQMLQDYANQRIEIITGSKEAKLLIQYCGYLNIDTGAVIHDDK